MGWGIWINRITIVLFAMLAGLQPVAWAAAPEPGRTVLSVNGKVKEGHVELDLAALQALPQHTFSTNTPWTKQPQTYSGPLLRDVLALVKAQGRSLKAMALNDYQISIPMSDAKNYDVIVAHHINGRPIAVRDRGPLFIIYPFDSKAELQSSRFYERAIWQLKSLQVE